MRILIMGGDGMLGHCLYRHFSPHHDVKVTLRLAYENYQHLGAFNKATSYCNIDIQQLQQVEQVIEDFKPEVVINCIGLIKQRPDKENALLNMEINALFPHQLSLICKKNDARLVHLSTDCVFDGKLGNYSEVDLCNAEDVYGKTKFLGELHNPHTITLRSSIIGFELKNKQSLLEWTLAQKGKTIQGFKNALYSGFTTTEMARIIERVILHYPTRYGLYQVASPVINKYDLLQLMNHHFDLKMTILPNEEFKCFRNLNGERFSRECDYTSPSWEAMIAELAECYIARTASLV
jgi:dTDP-4-dehydrorhamnose reductase